MQGLIASPFWRVDPQRGPRQEASEAQSGGVELSGRIGSWGAREGRCDSHWGLATSSQGAERKRQCSHGAVLPRTHGR